MWANSQFPADLVTFTEEIFNGKLHFLCSASPYFVHYEVHNTRYYFRKIQKCYSVEKWGWEGTWLPWRPLCREPRDIVQMCYMFEFSHTMKTLNCNVVSSIEVVYIILRWLAYPCRYGDMIPNVKRFSCDVWSCFPFIATSLTFFRKPC